MFSRLNDQVRTQVLTGVGTLFGLLWWLAPGIVQAQEETSRVVGSAGDTAWVLTSTVLVLMMVVPGLALFYGGLVRRKNVLATLMQSFILLALISVQWVLWGYSLAFGPDIGGVIGNLDYLGLAGVTGEPGPYADTIPHLAFMAFQGMFAAITPALITGAFAERMKFSAFLIFGLLWSTLVYDPLAHWVWGGGWIGAIGALDFAGGTVVHISSGVSALVCAIVIGKPSTCLPTTCRSPWLAPPFCGWAGLASTPAAPWGRMQRQPMPL